MCVHVYVNQVNRGDAVSFSRLRFRHQFLYKNKRKKEILSYFFCRSVRVAAGLKVSLSTKITYSCLRIYVRQYEIRIRILVLDLVLIVTRCDVILIGAVMIIFFVPFI